MYQPATRVLTVLELLQAHPCLSARQLANRLEVSTRTVRHYIQMLQDLGIPVEGERGRNGGYRLRPGFKLPPLMFSEDEAVALTLGLLTARRFGLSVAAPSVEGALAKIERVLPEQVRQRVQAVQQTIIINATSPYVAPASETLLTLSGAARNLRRVHMRYATWDGVESEREFDTYGVVHHDGRWYAAGFCHLRSDTRVFRLDRMRSVTLQDQHFERPQTYAVLAEVLHSIAQTPGRWTVEAVLHTTIEQARSIVPPSFGLLEAHERGVLMRCYVQQLDWIALFLAGLACDCTILGPAQLREALRDLALRAQSLAEKQLVIDSAEAGCYTSIHRIT
ncbi:MAG: YafY family transcriptional regulator [Roseiflexaceae bacterium]|nr:YafY family transcriptional regulator [Roseiflexaceae bacterium]